jgi:uncharacterized protein (DUF362 family)
MAKVVSAVHTGVGDDQGHNKTESIDGLRIIPMLEILRHKDLDIDDFSALMVRLGLRDAIEAAGSIVIKPNLVSGNRVSADSHVITDPALLRDVVIGILALNQRGRVFIAESDSGAYDFAYDKFANLGLPDCLLLEDETAKRVELLDLSRDRLLRVTSENFRYFRTNERQLWLSEILVNADFVVSLGNSKTHRRTGFTGACKNLFGCLPALEKSPYHPQVHKVIHDLTIAISPQLSMVDAFYAMEGNGPTFGRARDCGYLIVANDATEADLCAAQCAGLAPSQIKYLSYLTQTTRTGAHSGREYPTIVKLSPPTAFAHATQKVGSVFETAGFALVRRGKQIGDRRSLGQVLFPMVRSLGMIMQPVLLHTVGAGTLETMKRQVSRQLRRESHSD